MFLNNIQYLNWVTRLYPKNFNSVNLGESEESVFLKSVSFGYDCDQCLGISRPYDLVCVCAQSLIPVQLFATPQTAAGQAPLLMGTS